MVEDKKAEGNEKKILKKGFKNFVFLANEGIPLRRLNEIWEWLNFFMKEYKKSEEERKGCVIEWENFSRI